MQYSFTIREDTNLDDALRQLENSCRSAGIEQADLERVINSVSAVARNYSERGKQLLSLGSNFSLNQTLVEPPVTVELKCDFRANKRPLWSRIRDRLLGG